ncbi:retrovirus-related pol polyprotein from transposon TNT 1-94 [Tanacetum coccineum]|uniref:Retrovirus-related pol polyprotein from transposon TNT 1-94 n=1 Tax=Tanacetum coccineum TaxID=301880 RepID=A0ABQ5I3G0_9ASTR
MMTLCSLLSGGDNKPRCLKTFVVVESIMELYMMNRPYGRMILASVEKPRYFGENQLLIATDPVVTKLRTRVCSCVMMEFVQFHTRQFHHITSAQYGEHLLNLKYSVNQSSTPLSITYPSNNYQSSVHHNVYSPSSFIPQVEYSPTVNQQSEFSQLDAGLTILVFKHGDDPINAINHVMSLLSAVGRQNSFATGTTRTFTPGASGSNSGKQRIVICYNCKGEGHMSKHCTKPKRKRDDSWFKDKVLLVQAQAGGQIRHEEELAFLADPRIPEAQANRCQLLTMLLLKPHDLGGQVTPSSE